MNRHINRHLTILFAGLLFFAIPAGIAPAIAGQSFTLGSGKKIEVLSLTPRSARKRSRLLTLRYRTPTSLSATETLTREVNELWEHLVTEVEKDGYRGANIFAVKSGKSKKFVIRMKEGTWRLPEQGNPRKLTRAKITAIFERLEWLGKHKAIEAILLYLPHEYTYTVVDRAISEEPVTLSRAEYAKAARHFLAHGSPSGFRQEILNITILGGGKKARVKSLTTRIGSKDGNSTDTASRSTEYLELRDGALLITRSIAVNEDRTLVGKP